MKQKNNTPQSNLSVQPGKEFPIEIEPKTKITKGSNSKAIKKEAFIKTIPILCSYIFVGTAYGMMMENAGFHWYYSVFTSLTLYTGAFQFVLIAFLSSGASAATIAITALLMNSRQSFYSLSFIDVFRRMGKKKMFMIRTMTDETYAVNCSIDKENPDCEELMYYAALFSKSYWVIGTFIGGIAGQLIPYDLTGIDFCMTALFVILFIDQWEKTPDHRPALLGLGISLICLILFGTMSFMLPSLLLTSGILLVMLQMRKGAEK